MRHAGVRSVRIAFEAIGAADAPVVLVAGGISAHRHVAASARFPEAGWANDLVGAGRALDPARHRILAFDYIGADGTLDALIEIGRAACRERVCQYVETSGVAGSLKKKTETNTETHEEP